MSVDEQLFSVFISYATSDRDRAFEVCHHLEALDHKCWIAPRNIRSGHDYGEEIIRGIERSRCFVLILSAAANQSIYVKREVERAVAKAKPVFPVRVEDVPPSPALELHLASLQFLDVWTGVMQDHVAGLARDLVDAPQFKVPVIRGPKPSRPWWRWRFQLAVGAVVLAAFSVLQWRRPGTSPQSAQPWTHVPGAYALPSATPTPATQSVTSLEHCRASQGGPSFGCVIREPATILLSSALGDEVVVAGGSGSTKNVRKSFAGAGTYIPWLGPGTTARIRTADGRMSKPEALEDIPDMPAAIPVPSVDEDAPALVYAMHRHRLGGAAWSYLFFAPFDAQEVEWSTDSLGFTRLEAHPDRQRYGGPLWIDAEGSGDEEISIRWMLGGGAWSQPARYRFDASAARQRSIRPIVDLAGNIECYRMASEDSVHVACKTRSDVALGELFDELRWGPSPGKLTSVDDFDFKRWAATVTGPVIQPASFPGPPNCGRDMECRRKAEQQWRDAMAHQRQSNDARARQQILASRGESFVPWRTAPVRDYRNFLAIAEPVSDVFFSAVPRGGGTPVTARIKVSDREKW